MSIRVLETVIRERLGLDPEALGSSALSRTIQARLNSGERIALEEYLELLVSNPHEIESLADDLVVSETWFFRGGEALYYSLAQFVAQRAATQTTGLPVRVLSVPCSTGEEPLSLAIALHKAGLSADQYQIEAVDLSQSHIDKANAAIYGEFAFREQGLDIRSHFFKKIEANWVPHPHVRQAVRYRIGNIVDPQFLQNELTYDLILCRNLFIYLTADGRKRAFASLDRLLSPDGFICLTTAEADRLPIGQFTPVGPIEFGIYRRISPSNSSITAKTFVVSQPKFKSASQLGTVTLSTPRPYSAPAHPTITPLRIPPERTQKANVTIPDRAWVENDPLEEARSLANAGRLSEARVACEELVRSRGELPDAYSLLGVIHLAEGRLSEAVEVFRKALYLAPNHLEALTHLIILCNARGDSPQATLLQKRLNRLAEEDQS
jgi:chemotaxis protein methyltransferase WspC